MEDNVASTTASAILGILASIRIGDGEEVCPQGSTEQYNGRRLVGRLARVRRHTAPKNPVCKRRLSSSSDGSNRSRPGSITGTDTGDHLGEREPREQQQQQQQRSASSEAASAGHAPKRLTVRLRPQLSKSRSFCDPFDRNQLVDRIRTFNILNWTIEDDRLTPLECAVYGWRCHPRKKNVLRCQGCHAGIVVKLKTAPAIPAYSSSTYANYLFDEVDEFDEEADFRRTIVQSYLNRLHTDHYQGCIWKADNLDQGLIRRQYYLSNGDFERIVHDYNRIVKYLGLHHEIILSLKKFKRGIVSDGDMEILRRYTRNRYSEVILVMALLGWELKQQRFGKETLMLLKCRNCNRRILLGQVSEKDASGISKLDSCNYPAPRDNKEEEETNFDEIAGEYPEEEETNLLKEHERWCCLVSRGASGDEPGWKTVLRVLQSTLDEDAMDEDPEEAGYTFDDSLAQIKALT